MRVLPLAKITSEHLGDSYNTDKKEGFYVEFDQNQSATHWGYYFQDDKVIKRRLLNVDYKNSSAVDDRYDRREYSSEAKEGDQRDSDERYRAWVLDWLHVIAEQGGSFIECAFCGALQHECEKIIAGPRIYICTDCVEICSEILENDPPPPAPPPMM